MRLPAIELDDRRFQDLVSEARLRDQPLLPGVDRAQRLRSRHHADRAVRVDDGDDDLPAQPGAGQAARGAHGAARHPARRADRRAHQPALPAQRAGRAADRDRRRRDRGRHAPDGDRGGGRLPGRGGLHDPGRAARRVRRAPRRQADGHRHRRRDREAAGQRPAAVRRPAGGRRRAPSRLPGAARAADHAGRHGGLDGPRRGRRPRRPAAALGGLHGRRRSGRTPSCSRT